MSVCRCLERVKTAINADIDSTVSSCDTSLKHQAKPMRITDIPDESWQLFYFDGKNNLLVIDYISNYPEMKLLPNMSRSIFTRHGIPQVHPIAAKVPGFC